MCLFLNHRQILTIRWQVLSPSLCCQYTCQADPLTELEQILEVRCHVRSNDGVLHPGIWSARFSAYVPSAYGVV